MVHQNSPTVELCWEKIERSLRRANTESSMNFKRANMEPSVDFRKANMKPALYFWRANMETYQKYNVNLSKRVGKDGVFLGLAVLLLGIFLGFCPREIPRCSPASPRITPSFPPLLLRLNKSSFTYSEEFHGPLCLKALRNQDKSPPCLYQTPGVSIHCRSEEAAGIVLIY